jgi:hypothetical protein
MLASIDCLLARSLSEMTIFDISVGATMATAPAKRYSQRCGRESHAYPPISFSVFRGNRPTTPSARQSSSAISV